MISTPQWVDAFAQSDLSRGAVKLFVSGSERVAIIRTDDDELFAVDDRCPHEGYPLVQGDLKGTTLTCCFHNFKFDVRNGDCLKGAENVRTFPVRVQSGTVQVDVAPPDRAAAVPGLLDSLQDGLLQKRLGQATRALARLVQAEVEPAWLAAHLAAIDARYAEWGSSHTLALAADAIGLFEHYRGMEAVIPLAHVADQVVEAIVRRPLRDTSEPEVVADLDAAGDLFAQRVENEDLQGAEALLRGAVRTWGAQSVEPWLLAAAQQHFLSFGHALIYQTKVFDLVRAAPEHAEDLLVGHLASIVNATRYDVLPAWAGFRKRLKDHAGDLARWAHNEGTSDSGAIEVFREALDGSPIAAVDALVAALDAGAASTEVVSALSAAASARLLWFDAEIDASDDVQDTWLYASHTLTYCNALRKVALRRTTADVVRQLFFATRFVNRARLLTRESVDLEPGVAELAAIDSAVRGKRDTEAVSNVLAYLRGDGDVQALALTLYDAALHAPATLAIVTTHAVKNAVAGVEEFIASGDEVHLLGAVRLLSSNLVERSVRRTALESIRFVAEGKIPKTLTG